MVVGGNQVWRSPTAGCSDCEWDRLVRWAVRRRLVRSEHTDPAEISRAILAHIAYLEDRPGSGPSS